MGEKSKKTMRRKSKTGGSQTASANGDDASAVSKSSKKSFMGKLMKGKSKRKNKVSSSTNEDTTAMINESAEADKQAEVQKAFLKNGQEAKKPYMLKIALLLVDAKTRRFELLQLEFDSDKALVSDALSQIPIHVTEKVLSSQTYTGVCGASGVERKRSVPLFDFCKGNDVLVAIPSGTSAEECARLAKPILSDEKVIGMLSTSGINADPWTTAPIPTPRGPSSRRSRGGPKVEEAQKETSGTSTMVFYAVIILLSAAALAYWYHTKASAAEVVTEAGEPAEKWSAQVDMEPVWSSCYSMCDATRGVFETYIASPPKKG
ncbi:expressed unknown protein [Seminavis robusta]|uniref:Uncharacterized protein n=1 Tax=Seminavis robusta TaxID=568900 RepID=A0A9N8HR27_9STRA|nr:expressed unknown protein [Seminavis robusta]|eukprot:Sro1515_g279040.1 n/a (319) ;mRNA; f:20409-21478